MPITIVGPESYPDVWFLPCVNTPFINVNHPVFLAIQDRIVDLDGFNIKLRNLGWVTPDSCFREKSHAEQLLFYLYEKWWLDFGVIDPPRRCLLWQYYEHRSIDGIPPLPWFDLHGLLYAGEQNATTHEYQL